MKEKVKCPYCGEDIYVDTDDWYDEDEVHEYQCSVCGKYCMVYASLSCLAMPKSWMRCCKVCGKVEAEG